MHKNSTCFDNPIFRALYTVAFITEILIRFESKLTSGAVSMEFLVKSAIICSDKNPKVCAEGVAKMLTRGKIKGIQVKSCWCSIKESRIEFIIEAPSEEALMQVLEKIDVPAESILPAAQVAK